MATSHRFWPKQVDYMNALYNSPEDSFQDTDLKQSKLVYDGNYPLHLNGTFAIVFRLQSQVEPSKSWAVKCFNFPEAARQDRYRVLSQYLKGHRHRFMVEFSYLTLQR